MPHEALAATKVAFAPVNEKQLQEIIAHLEDAIGNDLTKLMRSGKNNVIEESKNFHYDVRVVNGVFKFDVQFRKGGAFSQQTAAVLFIEGTASSVADFLAALRATFTLKVPHKVT